MQNKNPKWYPGAPAGQTDLLEVLYIDSQNQICTVTLTGTELRSFQYKILAWRDHSPKIQPPSEVLLGTVYWNYVTGKFWPFSARKPPNPKLPNYFKILIWTQPDGSHRLEYKLVDRPVK